MGEAAVKQHGFEVEQHRFDCHPGEPRAWARVAAGVSLALAVVFAMAGASGASLLPSDGKAAHAEHKSAHEQDGCVHSAEDGDPGSGHHGQACDDATPAPGVGPDAVPTSTPPSPAPKPVTVSPPIPVAVPSRPPIAVRPLPTPVPPDVATPPSPVAVTLSERPTAATLAAGAAVRHSGAPETAPETAPEMAVPVRHGQFEFVRPGGIARLFEPVAQPVAALFLLGFLAVVFLLVSGRLDRRHPRLVGGPLDRRDEHLEFE
jgi:hypothetical protein